VQALAALLVIKTMVESLMSKFSRRRLLAMAATGAASATLSACTSVRVPGDRAYVQTAAPRPVELPQFGAVPAFGGYRQMYAATFDDGHDIPAVPIEEIDPKYYRQLIPNPTGEQPGTVVVDTSNHFLYLVGNFGEATRYGVGLGRQGFEWSGRGVIQWKQRWPRWFPPDEMIDRQPELEQYRARQVPGTNDWEGGMEAGVMNPLGARALYIFQDGKDTLYRVHGSPEWWSIGKSVSSGCVRLIHQDIIDLYDRVPDGTPMVVTSGLSPVV
jgi:lipoprotein-anchoring transpeptidase ErfK/SrfK